MPKSDMHWAMAQVAQEDGWGAASNEDFITHQQLKMLMVGPAHRAGAIRQIDSTIAQDDRTTLRSKAQLLELRRRLSVTHENMLKAGR